MAHVECSGGEQGVFVRVCKEWCTSSHNFSCRCYNCAQWSGLYSTKPGGLKLYLGGIGYRLLVFCWPFMDVYIKRNPKKWFPWRDHFTLQLYKKNDFFVLKILLFCTMKEHQEFLTKMEISVISWERLPNGSLWGFQILNGAASTVDFNSMSACQKLLTPMGFAIETWAESEISDW